MRTNTAWQSTQAARSRCGCVERQCVLGKASGMLLRGRGGETAPPKPRHAAQGYLPAISAWDAFPGAQPCDGLYVKIPRAGVPSYCGVPLPATLFTGADLTCGSLPGGMCRYAVTSVAACCEKCHTTPFCGSFTLKWDDAAHTTGTCMLKQATGYTVSSALNHVSSVMTPAAGAAHSRCCRWACLSCGARSCLPPTRGLRILPALRPAPRRVPRQRRQVGARRHGRAGVCVHQGRLHRQLVCLPGAAAIPGPGHLLLPLHGNAATHPRQRLPCWLAPRGGVCQASLLVHDAGDWAVQRAHLAGPLLCLHRAGRTPARGRHELSCSAGWSPRALQRCRATLRWPPPGMLRPHRPPTCCAEHESGEASLLLPAWPCQPDPHSFLGGIPLCFFSHLPHTSALIPSLHACFFLGVFLSSVLPFASFVSVGFSSFESALLLSRLRCVGWA